MLYPKEDKENKVLMYACRNCDYKQVGTEPNHGIARYFAWGAIRKNGFYNRSKDPIKYSETL